MRVVIMGAGAVGGYFGSVLSRNNVDVTFIARGAHLNAMKQRGLKIDSHWGDFIVESNFTDSLDSVGHVDFVIHCTKLYSNTTALPLLDPVIGKETVILTIQNGISSGEIISKYYGWDRVLQGATYIESEIIEPGHIQQTGSVAKIEFGENDGEISERCNLQLDFGSYHLPVFNIPKEATPDVNIPFIYISLSQKGISPEDSDKAFTQSEIVKSGLFSRSDKGTFDRFRSRIMFPIFHPSGKPIAFGGRIFNSTDPAKYLNSPETPLYKKSSVFMDCKPLVIQLGGKVM